MIRNSILILWYFLCVLQTACGDANDKKNRAPQKQLDTSHWTPFTGSHYGFSFKHPQKYTVRKDSIGEQHVVFSIFPESREPELDFPLGVHEQPQLGLLAIYPFGLGTELPSGMQVHLNKTQLDLPEVSFSLDSTASMALLMKDSIPWAYFLVPAEKPRNWNKHGFVFVQYPVTDFAAACYDADTGNEKDLKMCDPMNGDQFVRKGKVIDSSRRLLTAILESLQFEKQPTGHPRLETPKRGGKVTPPLDIAGTAPGSWFHEGTFTIEIKDHTGKLLGQSRAKATTDWMQETNVPFEGRIDFDAVSKSQGRLLLHRANPSALPSNADSLVVEVNFQ